MQPRTSKPTKASKQAKQPAQPSQASQPSLLNRRPRGWNLTPEHQRKAQACRTSDSLAASGRKGFEALERSHGIDYILENAAKWRRNHPNRFEQKVIDWLTERGLDFERDRRIEGVRYCDFVLHAQRIIVEVDGNVWHTNNELHGEDREGRDKRNDETLKEKGWTVIRIPTDQIKQLDSVLQVLTQ